MHIIYNHIQLATILYKWFKTLAITYVHAISQSYGHLSDQYAYYTHVIYEHSDDIKMVVQSSQVKGCVTIIFLEVDETWILANKLLQSSTHKV